MPALLRHGKASASLSHSLFPAKGRLLCPVRLELCRGGQNKAACEILGKASSINHLNSRRRGDLEELWNRAAFAVASLVLLISSIFEYVPLSKISSIASLAG
jgi:hypothetical protein